MRPEIQKALNQLYHNGEMSVELVNRIVSYIEKLEAENGMLKLQIAKLVKLYDQE